METAVLKALAEERRLRMVELLLRKERCVRALARELGISRGSVRDWAIYIEHGFFDWIDKPWRTRRPELMQKAVDFWFENYPIGCSDVAKRFGIRHAALFRMIERAVATLPEQLRPKRIRYWDAKPETSLETFRMRIEKLSDIPADRPLTLEERKALFKEVEDARGRLICAESLLEVALENCWDERAETFAGSYALNSSTSSSSRHEVGIIVLPSC